MKTQYKLTRSLVSFGAAFVLGFGLSACSSGIGDTELELNGKVFDAFGLTSSGKKGETKLSERAPLVLPPTDRQLPRPGRGSAQAQQWPDDPDARKRRLAQLAKAKKADDCSGGNFKKSRGLEAIEKASDPLKDCKSGNILKALGISRPDNNSDDDAP